MPPSEKPRALQTLLSLSPQAHQTRLSLSELPLIDASKITDKKKAEMPPKLHERVRQVRVEKMHIPAVVRLSRSFWDDSRNGTVRYQAAQSVDSAVRISTLELPHTRAAAL
jgi:hypothetical protein